jgi:HK97 family phage major capsid protein
MGEIIMAYNDLIAYGNITLTPDEIAEIFKDVQEQSSILRLGRRLRNMTTNELKLKVSTALPAVNFVGTKGTTQTFPADALKQTTDSEWDNVSIKVGELAAIVVVPNNVFNDANFDIFGELRSQLPTAIAKKVDSAVIYGEAAVDVPDDWSDGIFEGMPADNIVTVGEVGDIYDDFLAASGVFYQVENDGYDVDGILAASSLKASLRSLRADSGTGAPLFTPSIQSAGEYTLAGVPMSFPKNGGLNPAITLAIAGDWDKLVYSIRQDVTFDVFTTGVVQDGNGAITHNLMQEDLTAIRVTFRMAWGLPEQAGSMARWDGTTASGVYPFSAYVPA